MLIDAIILAGGLGKRFNNSLNNSSTLPKQFHIFQEIPIFLHSLKALSNLKIFRQFIIVLPKEYIQQTSQMIQTYGMQNLKICLVAGGKRRQDSTLSALEYLEGLESKPERVLIHDACRPYISKDFGERIKKALIDRSYAAWIPAIPVTDTIKKVENSMVSHTLNRDEIFRVQTPQIFEFDVILNLFQKIKNNLELNFTDDASICEYYGIPVGVFEGDTHNIKVTYNSDWDSLKNICVQELASTSIV
jgi:2-C-methyl-D-erythritol 4-phosphate cytidylyltransferase